MKNDDPKKTYTAKKDKPQELLPGQTAQSHKAREFNEPTPEELAAEEGKRKRARKITLHKYFIIFLVGMVIALGYEAVQIFQTQTGMLDKEHDRAYVMPKAPTDEDIPVELPLIVTIPVQNTGNTPAFGVTVKMHAHVVKYTLAESGGVKSESGQEHAFQSKSVVIKGGGEDSEIASFRLTSADPIAGDFEQMKTKKEMALYITGTVNYRDSFNASHFSDFCFGYKSDGTGKMDSFSCPSHHDAD